MNLQASGNPVADIEKIAYQGQEPRMRMYRTGYESFLNEMPVLNSADPLLDEKVGMSGAVMKNLANELRREPWVFADDPGENGFSRTILALESPKPAEAGWKEGTEFVLAKWGDGMTSPVHGHALGFMYEEVLFGKMKVNTYRMTSPTSSVVRLVSTDIIGKGTFVNTYTPQGNYNFRRPALIHNFTSVGFSASLHYLSEHTRDGRDNGFQVEYFEDLYDLRAAEVEQISSSEAMYLPKGSVVLVRSTNVPEYGDHFIVITGAPVLKEHGLRPKETAFDAPHSARVLDRFPMKTGLILLKLNAAATLAFHDFHGITIEDREVKLPDASPLSL